MERLANVPEHIKAVPELLLDCLAKIFHLTNDEFTVLSVAFWFTSGAPAVEIDTDVFGGLHWVHGTHMRSWIWVYLFLLHPLLKCKCGPRHVPGCARSVGAVKALCLIAMLTCCPATWRRICMQAISTSRN